MKIYNPKVYIVIFKQYLGLKIVKSEGKLETKSWSKSYFMGKL